MRNFRIANCILLFLVLIFFATSYAIPKDRVDKEIEDIQKMIEEKGYNWTAGRTSVSELSEEEFQNLLGLKVPEWYDEWFKTAKKIEAPPKIYFPDVFDWRDSAGVTPVKSQGGCGSCWAFGALAALESMAKIYGEKELDLSEQQILSCRAYGWGCDGGWMSYAYELFRDFGSVSEECMPYHANDTDPCIQESCEVLAKITGWIPVAHNVDAIKTALLTGPVSCAMRAYNDFQHYDEGCYENPGLDPPNHAILLIGWNDTLCGGDGAWIGKNSWGTGWGMGGYFYIKYNTCHIGYATDLINYIPPGPFVTLENFSVNDSLGGNGNGRPEPEETVNIYLTLSNIWATLNGAQVTAWADTDGIFFINDRSDFGDMSVHDTVNNYSDPIQFWVPSNFPQKRVNFTFEITGNGGDYTKSWTEEIWIGKSSILLVDDDQGSSIENHYTGALDLLGPLYDIWDKTNRPDESYNLSDYKVVIWFTGDHRDSVFSDEDIQTLMTFLDNGGDLFLSSQDAVEVLSSSSDPQDTLFLNNYLHVGYGGNFGEYLIAEQEGDEIGDGMYIYPLGPPGANNQTSKDILIPDFEADPVLIHSHTWWVTAPDSFAAAKFQNDLFRVVVFGFGFEAINPDKETHQGKDLSKPYMVMQKVLDWLMTPSYMPGDPNGDQTVDLGDVVYLINYLFKGESPPEPLAAGDANGDCVVDLGDVVYLINYLFKGGAPPVEGCA
ncbi:MAG: hypothetical protein KAX39_01870 [candidate division Zixibacteria bacterium]|nr:hypothetical protein [candidate division Zixibacteria bacterium]